VIEASSKGQVLVAAWSGEGEGGSEVDESRITGADHVVGDEGKRAVDAMELIIGGEEVIRVAREVAGIYLEGAGE
jgi:hypothetical protein